MKNLKKIFVLMFTLSILNNTLFTSNVSASPVVKESNMRIVIGDTEIAKSYKCISYDNKKYVSFKVLLAVVSVALDKEVKKLEYNPRNGSNTAYFDGAYVSLFGGSKTVRINGMTKELKNIALYHNTDIYISMEDDTRSIAGCTVLFTSGTHCFIWWNGGIFFCSFSFDIYYCSNVFSYSSFSRSGKYAKPIDASHCHIANGRRFEY